MIVRIRMQNSKQAGASLQVLKSPYLIGRHANCDLKVGSPRVSVHHCAILIHGRRVALKDLESTNGTRINGEPVHGERELRHGDVIWVGPALIEVFIEEDELDILAAGSGDYTATNPYLDIPRDHFTDTGPKTDRP
jgi:pSer/pThr/pTyr-binding forkhead associated (FHA) protein